MTKSNRSILQCPECKKPLVNIGSRVERIHPIARLIKNHYLATIFGWMLLVPGICWLTYQHVDTNGGGSLNMSFGFFSLLMVPFIINFFLLRMFPIYRITDCPYCGFHEKQKLGLSESGEL